MGCWYLLCWLLCMFVCIDLMVDNMKILVYFKFEVWFRMCI